MTATTDIPDGVWWIVGAIVVLFVALLFVGRKP